VIRTTAVVRRVRRFMGNTPILGGSGVIDMHRAHDLLDPLLLNLKYEVEAVAYLIAHDPGDPLHRRRGWRRVGGFGS